MSKTPTLAAPATTSAPTTEFKDAPANAKKLTKNEKLSLTLNKKHKTPFNSKYFILDNEIISKTEVKDPGLTFDTYNTFKNHIDSLCTKSARITAMGYRLPKEIRMPMMTTKQADPRKKIEHDITFYVISTKESQN